MPRIKIEGGDAFECAATDTILRSALRAGVTFPYSCNTGSCGNCRFRLKDGGVEHVRDHAPAWTEGDRERGRWLGCQARPLSDCLIQVRLDPGPGPPYRPVRTNALLTDVVEVTHDISEFGFAISGSDRFLPGQYALLEIEGVRGVRAYSMCNLPGAGAWRFLIKRVPNGAATGVLFDVLSPGDMIAIDGPYGQAYLREDSPRDLLLVAGGSGLSPMISIARAAASSRSLANREIHLVYGGRLPRDICGEEIVTKLPGFGERLFYTGAVSESSDRWSGPNGFIHDVVREKYVDRLVSFEVYFAGPSLMAQAMQRMLHDAGVPAENIHFDEFF